MSQKYKSGISRQEAYNTLNKPGSGITIGCLNADEVVTFFPEAVDESVPDAPVFTGKAKVNDDDPVPATWKFPSDFSFSTLEVG